MVRVVLVDDQEMIRMGMRMVLESQPAIEIVGEADDGDSALELLDRVEADVVLMDVRMPRMSGVEATRRLREREDTPSVLILTTFDLDEYAFAALKAGASGFLLKDARPADLLNAIRNVAAGDAVMAPSTTRRLLDHVLPTLPTSPRESDKRLDVLTDREREVLVEIAAGATNSEIARKLYMAEGTVKTHIGRLLAKLHCRDRVGLVLLAYETGFVRR